MIVNKIAKRFNRSLNKWASKTTWFENMAGFAGCKKLLDNYSFNLEIANLGSSSGYYAFNYESLGIKGLNLAMPKQSLLADYEMIRNYFSYLKEGAVVLIPLCLFSALEGEDAAFPDKYYVLLQSESIPHYSWKKRLQVMDLYNNPIKYLPLFSFPREILRPLKPRNKHMTKEEMDKDAKRWVNDWIKEFSIIDFDKPLSLRNNDSYNSAAEILNMIIEFCYCRSFNPVIVLPPISKSLSNLYTTQMKQLLITDFVSKGNVRNAPFLNYLDDSEFDDESCFRNAYFLSDNGSKAFTQKLMTDLRNLNLIM